MNILEKNIEQLIFDCYHKNPESLARKGLDLRGQMFRQVNLGRYGTIDLLCVEHVRSQGTGHRHLNVHIIELKKDQVDINAVMQAYRYKTGLDHLIFNRYNLKKHYTEFYITVIGNSVNENGDFLFYLNNKDYNFDVLTYSLDLDEGLKFTEVGKNWQYTDAKPLTPNTKVVKSILHSTRLFIPSQIENT